ncbi:MAG: methyl-accepting chemotaxis protein [Firmicutes bacterium]|nr:methyl-accepting chemotaxis protein [Bacillota bacterium]
MLAEGMKRIKRMKFIGNIGKTSIRDRLIYSFIFVSLVPVFIVGLMSYTSSRSAMTRKFTQSTLDELNQTAAHVRLKLNEFETVSVRLLIDQQFHQAIWNYNNLSPTAALGQRHYVNRFFNNYLISNPDIFGFVFISEAADREPLVFAKDYGPELRQFCTELRATETYRQILQAGDRINWASLKVEGSPLLYLARCITESVTETPLGVLMILVEEETIDRIINSHLYTGLDSSTNDLNKYSVIIDSEGDIISSPMKNHIGGQISALLANTEPLQPIMLGTESDRDYEQKRGSYISKIEGKENLVTFKTISGVTGIGSKSDWHLLCFTQTSYLYAESRTVGLTTLIMAGFFALLAAGISFTVALGISNPLNEVMEAMAKAEKGDLSVRVRLNTEDELGVLGTSFNRMVERIGELIDETQVAVKSVLEHSFVLEDSSLESVRTAESIARIMSEISTGTIEQTKEAENSSGRMRNLAVQIGKVNEQADEVGKISSSTKELSYNSQETVQLLLANTKETEEITTVMLDVINDLRTSVGEISRITEVISNLAEQSNLLALNASIEAARAGEMGKGFAVVAEEMNKLAGQSRDGATTINTIVKSILEKIMLSTTTMERGYAIMAKQMESVAGAQESFTRIIEAMDETTRRMVDMGAIINEVDRAKEETTQSIEVISAILEETAASAQEVSAATEEQTAIADQVKSLAAGLREMAENLVQMIERFQVDAATEARETNIS